VNTTDKSVRDPETGFFLDSDGQILDWDADFDQASEACGPSPIEGLFEKP
jgi:hypothetical protein